MGLRPSSPVSQEQPSSHGGKLEELSKSILVAQRPPLRVNLVKNCIIFHVAFESKISF